MPIRTRHVLNAPQYQLLRSCAESTLEVMALRIARGTPTSVVGKARRSHKNRKTKVMAQASFISTFGRVLGPLLFGFMFHKKQSEHLANVEKERKDNAAQYPAEISPQRLSGWKERDGCLRRKVRVSGKEYGMKIMEDLEYGFYEPGHGSKGIERESPDEFSLCIGPLRADLKAHKGILVIEVNKPSSDGEWRELKKIDSLIPSHSSA